MERFYETLRKIRDLAGEGEAKAVDPESLSGADREVLEKGKDLPGRFIEAMDDDFNTARAMGYLFELVRLLNGTMADKDFRLTDASRFVLSEARKKIRELGKVLGLFLEDPDDYFASDRSREAEKMGLSAGEIEALIEERRRAREEKNWKRADEIRDALAAKRIVLKDGPSGTTWKMG